jgi:predicted nucleotidyltransferase
VGTRKNMRVLKQEINIIKNNILQFDKEAQVYLFGSRVDDNKKGGDIDILIVSDFIKKYDLIKIEYLIFKQIDEQKIDFIVSKKNITNNFIKMILSKNVINLCQI